MSKECRCCAVMLTLWVAELQPANNSGTDWGQPDMGKRDAEIQFGEAGGCRMRVDDSPIELAGDRKDWKKKAGESV